MSVIGGMGAGRGGSVQLNTGSSSVRNTPRTDFGTIVRNGVANGASAVAGATGVAAPFVPGGAVVSAAVNSAAGAVSGGTGYSGGTQNIPGMDNSMSNATGGATSGKSSQQAMLDQTKEMQEMQMSFSMQYLQLQDKMQNENRQYTTISNVMKTKHDTAKATINNVR